MEGNVDVLVVLVLMGGIIPVALWNNWIFHGPDGFALEKRPSILRFYATLLRHPIRTFEGSIFWPEPSDHR